MANWPSYTEREKHEKDKPRRKGRYTWTMTTIAPCGHGVKAAAHSVHTDRAKKSAYAKLVAAVYAEVRKCGKK